MSSVTQEFRPSRAVYPPVVESSETLGYIVDQNGIGYSRDIGRSSSLGGRQYYIFGDTFCKNVQGDFVGLTCNSAAIIPDSTKPLESAYLNIRDNGMVDALVPLTDAECRLSKEKVRVILWAFGGISESRPGLGWMWYQNAEILTGGGQDRVTFHGTGIARISSASDSGQLQTARCKDLVYESPSNRLNDTRIRDLIFGPTEPRFGTFSSLVEGEYIYLWGDLDGKIFLARVSKYVPTTRSAYAFWDGLSYVEALEKAMPILDGYQHGAIFKSALFSAERPWVFVGCTKWADSRVMLGAGTSLEGPWEPIPLMAAVGVDYPQEYMYCMYPHAWALREEEGELMVSWSEHWPGGVVAAKVRLAMGNSSI